VLANGVAYSQDQFSRFANYVMQDDLLMETMTVRECLDFAASLKVKGSKDERTTVVTNIIKAFKLEKC